MGIGKKMCRFKNVKVMGFMFNIHVTCSNPLKLQDDNKTIKNCCRRLCKYYESR